MKKLFPLFGAALLAFAVVSCGEAKAKKTKIGVSIPAADHGWTGGVIYSAESAKKKLEAANPDFEIIISTARDASEQVNKIENLLVQGVKAVVVLPQEPGPLTNVCDMAKQQGVFLVTVDRGLEKPVQDVYVAGDNAGFGRTAAQALVKALSLLSEIAGLPDKALDGTLSMISRASGYELPSRGILDRKHHIHRSAFKPETFRADRIRAC